MNGFSALSQYDENSDGIIDINDNVFASLRLWIDGNADGLSNNGELLSLNEGGVVSLDLSFTQGFVDANANDHQLASVWTDSHGLEYSMDDVWLIQSSLKGHTDASPVI